MILKGKYYSIHRECLASAPLPDAHKKFVVGALRKLQAKHRSADYSVVDYDLKAGVCRFLAFDCTKPWPEATLCFEYSRTTDAVRRIKYREGSGPVLTDQALVLPKWNPYSKSSHRKLSSAQKEKKDLLSRADRPVGRLWKEPEKAEAVSWKGVVSADSPKVCSLQCEGCYLALGKGKKSERHLTAIKRFECSRPVKNALRDKLIDKSTTFLDYGCGQGEDCQRLDASGVKVQGWDPVFKPLPLPKPADIVNLGYVINVIEDPQERISTLTKAFDLSGRLLVVSAYMDNGKATRHAKAVPFGDGVITSRGTFQKLFRQKELRLFIESTLGVQAHSADFGVYYVFKDESLLARFTELRDADRPKATRTEKPKRVKRLGKDELMVLVEMTTRLGRLPVEEEFGGVAEARRTAGSLEYLQEQIFGELDADEYEKRRRRRKTDMLVHLASSRLSTAGRPLLRELSKTEKADLKSFFNTYREACGQADELLMQLGNSEAIDAACEAFGMGKLLPDALYIHVSLEDELPLLLRLMVGCARSYAEGELPENVSVIKLKRDGHGVTFIECEDFFAIPHPAVLRITKVKFLKRKVVLRDFSESLNPTIYHRKEAFLSPEHPDYDRMAALTVQEEEAGLLGGPYIGRRNAWEQLLAEGSFSIVGHQLTPLS